MRPDEMRALADDLAMVDGSRNWDARVRTALREAADALERSQRRRVRARTPQHGRATGAGWSAWFQRRTALPHHRGGRVMEERTARERLIEAGAALPWPASMADILDAFLAHPDDLVALLLERHGKNLLRSAPSVAVPPSPRAAIGTPEPAAKCGINVWVTQRRSVPCVLTKGHPGPHSDRFPDLPDAEPVPTEPAAERVESIARFLCDEAKRWGDRLHGWDDSGEDVRDTFRESARSVIALWGCTICGGNAAFHERYHAPIAVSVPTEPARKD